MTPRGIRNANPMNLIDNGLPWGGLAEPRNDGRFLRFDDPVYGIRAGVKVLLTYYDKYHLRTVKAIINRFAPTIENDTSAYISSVCKSMGIRFDDVIDLRRPSLMRGMVKAIIRHENGIMPYPDSVIDEAMELAGITLEKTNFKG